MNEKIISIEAIHLQEKQLAYQELDNLKILLNLNETRITNQFNAKCQLYNIEIKEMNETYLTKIDTYTLENNNLKQIIKDITISHQNELTKQSESHNTIIKSIKESAERQYQDILTQQSQLLLDTKSSLLKIYEEQRIQYTSEADLHLHSEIQRITDILQTTHHTEQQQLQSTYDNKLSNTIREYTLQLTQSDDKIKKLELKFDLYKAEKQRIISELHVRLDDMQHTLGKEIYTYILSTL